MQGKKDIRSFKRYNSNFKCEVIFPSVPYKGKVIDYSEGICVLIENGPDVVQGSAIHVTVPGQDLEFNGEVAWVEKVDNHLKAGIRRIDKLKGSLKVFRFADILMGTYRRAKTGILEITVGSTVKKICIDRGDIIYAASNDKDEHLGGHLLKKGIIKLAELERASSTMRKTGRKLGEILVESCCLSPEELVREVRNQIKEIIFSLFPLEEGKFEFKEGNIFLDETITLHCSTADIIYQGVKRINNYSFIKATCPSIDDILNFSLDPLRIYQSLHLDSADEKILSYVNGLYPLEKILLFSLASNFDTLKTISAFMTIGLIHVKKDDEAPVELPIDEMFGEPEEAPPDYPEKIGQILNRCGGTGYYEILGVSRDASIEDIRKAYSRLIRQVHPDRHFSCHSCEIKDTLLKIVAKSAKAYEILADPDRRREYDRTLIRKDSERAPIR
jgi:hypothetical protein